MKNLVHLLLGTLFGLVLFKSEVATLPKIRAMFAFEEPDLYLIIGSGVLVGLVGLQLLKLLERKKGESRYHYPTKKMSKGVVAGGFLFGMGWYITGACPGPIAVQIGAGAWPAVATLVGAVLGTYLYACVRGHLPH